MSCNPFSVAGSHTVMGEREVMSCCKLFAALFSSLENASAGLENTTPGVLCKILLWLFLFSAAQPLPPLWAWGVRRP